MEKLLPVGYKFVPTNLEIISFLHYKLQNPQHQSGLIKDDRIYAISPDSLNWDPIPCLNAYERYYFAKRSPVGKEKQKNTKRSLETGEGYWRKSRENPIFDSQNRVVGDVALLNFFRDDLATKQRVKTEFIMHEFTIRSDTFQEWVVCRIKDKKREKEGTKKNFEIHNLIPQPLEIQLQELPQPPEIPLPINNVMDTDFNDKRQQEPPQPPEIDDAMDTDFNDKGQQELPQPSKIDDAMDTDFKYKGQHLPLPVEDYYTQDNQNDDDRLMFSYEELFGTDDHDNAMPTLEPADHHDNAMPPLEPADDHDIAMPPLEPADDQNGFQEQLEQPDLPVHLLQILISEREGVAYEQSHISLHGHWPLNY